MKRSWPVLMAIGLLAIVLVPAGLVAQPVPGDRLRVRPTDGPAVTGTLVESTPTGLRLRDERADVVVERSRIRTVERSLGTESHFARNFFVSIAAGALLVGGYTALSYDPSDTSDFFGPNDRAEAFALGALGGAILAIPIGVITGIASRTESWEPISLTAPADFALRVAPRYDGSLGLSFRFTL